jgi:sulfur carrier protein
MSAESSESLQGLQGLRLEVNGQHVELAAGSPLSAVVERFTTATRGVAVAVNDEIVPRATWSEHEVADGDRIEIVTAKQGG